MSHYQKNIPTSRKSQNLQWINTMVNVHDLKCFCEQPLQHIILGIVEQEPDLKFNPEDSKKIEKCLTTTENGATDAVETFGGDELEQLFAENFGEEDADG